MVKQVYCKECGYFSTAYRRARGSGWVETLFYVPAICVLIISSIDLFYRLQADVPLALKTAALDNFFSGIPGMMLVGLIGLPYSLWRLTTWRPRCQLCLSDRIIPKDSPIAIEARQDY